MRRRRSSGAVREVARIARRAAPVCGPIGLVGSPVDVDTVAARLLEGGGDRRALAPVTRPEPGLLAPCAVIVAVGLAPAYARRVAAARRPWVALIAPGTDRYSYGALPRLGAENAIPPHAAFETFATRLVTVVPLQDAAALAARLPSLRPALDARLARGEAPRAALLAAVGFRRPAMRAHAAALDAGLLAGGDDAPQLGAVLAAASALAQAPRTPRLARAAAAYAIGRAASSAALRGRIIGSRR